jgi:hypothetical protein
LPARCSPDAPQERCDHRVLFELRSPAEVRSRHTPFDQHGPDLFVSFD